VIAVIDPLDAFLGSLVQCLATLGAEVQVHRADGFSAGTLATGPVEGLVLASGSGRPTLPEAVREAIRRAQGRIPILGIGLGHLELAVLHGASTVPSPQLRHGRTSPVLHRGRGLFAGLDNPFAAARYDALTVQRGSLPAVLELTAWTPDGEVMGLRHRDHATWGVQFPPQSILTRPGLRLVENFLTLCRQHKEVPR
jgi:anthranilate synthase/aminodeoxychorismate synthase-like glutamine amidotransferase